MEMLASQELVGASWSGALPADILDLPTGWEAGPWARLVQASAVLSGQRWMLVGVYGSTALGTVAGVMGYLHL